MNASAATSIDVQPEVQNLLKKCPFCSEAILMDAQKCRYCGEFLDPELRASASSLSQQKWNPSIAAALSLLVPGGGHIYRGKPVKGFLWLFLVAAGYSLYILPGIILHLVCIPFAAMGNPMVED
ncbi:MAG: hypothetical protein AB1847_22740 [bacterium]